MKLEECLVLFNDFLSPCQKLEQTNLNQVSIETIVHNINKNFREKHAGYSASLVVGDEKLMDSDQMWSFALISMNLLETLNVSEFEVNNNNCYLSIQNERLLNVLFQLFVCFGIHYNLEDFIGIPIEKLSKYGVNITKKRDLITPIERNRRLVISMDFLLRLKNLKREHMDLINGQLYRKYMHELLCGLIQVTRSPNNLKPETKSRFETWLNSDLFSECDGSVLISSLLMAQSSAREKKIVWFLLKIGQLLTKCLLRPNSVMNVIRAVLNEMDAVANVSLASDWKKCDVIARIIAQCPKEVAVEEYIKLLAPQLVDLYFKFDQRYTRHFCRVAGSIYSLFAHRWPQLTRQYLTTQLLQPLDFHPPSTIKMTRQELLIKLEHISTIYISSTEPSWQTLSQIPIQLAHLVFQTYTLLEGRVSACLTRTKCEDLLTFYLRMMPNSDGTQLAKFLVDLIRCELVPDNQLCCLNCTRSVQYNFEGFADEDNVNKSEELGTSSDANFVLEFLPEKTNEPVTIDQVERRSKSIVKLLTKLNSNETKAEYMLYLFDQINQCLPASNSPPTSSSGSKNDQTFVQLETKVTQLENEINSKIVYFTQLSNLFESIEPTALIENHSKIIPFCQLILDKVTIAMVDVDSQTEERQEEELIHLVFSVVSVFTTGLVELSDEVKESLKLFQPLLATFKSMSPSEDLVNMASALEDNISRITGAGKERQETKTEQTMEREVRPMKSHKVLIEEIDDEYSSCMKDVNDALIPIRAHGLVTIRKLIEKRDERVLANLQTVRDISVKGLKSGDSYLYLAAINALIAIAHQNPTESLNILIAEYQSKSKQLDTENRMKIGEVLTKSIRNYNELVPKYAPLLLNAFLSGCRDPDEFLRASSLSNLGETCKLMNYSLTQHITEITNCLTSLLDTDPSMQVKRSAAMVIKMVVEGLKKESFLQVLGKQALPLYRLLTKTFKSSEDDVVRLHCQLTLDNLNELVTGYMFPEADFVKKISI